MSSQWQHLRVINLGQCFNQIGNGKKLAQFLTALGHGHYYLNNFSQPTRNYKATLGPVAQICQAISLDTF